MPNQAPGVQYAYDPSGYLQGLQGPGGVVYPLSQSAVSPTFPDDIYTATSAASVVASPCFITGIRCQSATAGPITITVYDNIATAAGNVLYTGSLNTGQEAAIPTPILAFTGVNLSFTGTATFDFSIRSAQQ